MDATIHLEQRANPKQPLLKESWFKNQSFQQIVNLIFLENTLKISQQKHTASTLRNEFAQHTTKLYDKLIGNMDDDTLRTYPIFTSDIEKVIENTQLHFR